MTRRSGDRYRLRRIVAAAFDQSQIRDQRTSGRLRWFHFGKI
jgi:hypothetical protein